MLAFKPQHQGLNPGQGMDFKFVNYKISTGAHSAFLQAQFYGKMLTPIFKCISSHLTFLWYIDKTYHTLPQLTAACCSKIRYNDGDMPNLPN